jgi:AcrR family transcriptional regulator
MGDTKQRILDAAERLFGELGYDGTSLRDITSAAEVNLAAVNYHFQSKEALLRAVLTRRLGPVNRERLELLDRYEAECAGNPPEVPALVNILLRPLMALGGSGPESVGFRTLFGRMYAEPSRNIHKIFFEEMRDIVIRFFNAFQRALPWLPPVELYWRMHFMIGSFAHTLAGGVLLQAMSDGICDPNDLQSITGRLTAFAVGGLTAPLAEITKRTTKTAKNAKVMKRMIS